MSLDPHINAEVRIENEATKLKMIVDSREPETSVKSWVWISAFYLFSVSTLGSDCPGLLIVELIFYDVDLVTAVVAPDTITINELLNEVKLCNWALSSNAYIVTVEPDKSSWAIIIAVTISRWVLVESKSTYIT
jgi:hypothetical protein